MSKKQPEKRVSYNPLLKSFPDSEKINAVSEGAEVLYLRLIAASDDAGRYWAEPKMVLGKLFTHRAVSGTVTAKGVAKRLAELEKVGLIRLYEVEGKRYLEMVKVFKRLRPELALHLFCPEPDSPDESDGDSGSNPVIQAIRRQLEAAQQTAEMGRIVTSRHPAAGADDAVHCDDVVTTSSQRRHNVGPTSSPCRHNIGPTSSQRCSTNPTQPYPTQPNPTAPAAAAGVAAPNGAAHQAYVAASTPSTRAELVGLISDTSKPTNPVETTPKGAAPDDVAPRESAAHVAAPCVGERAAEGSGRDALAEGPPAKPLPCHETPEFLAFWAAYPARNGRKAGPIQAARRFSKLAPRDKPLCIEAAGNYARETRAGQRIPKDATGFLRKGFWRAWIGPPAVERSTKYIDPNSEEAQEWSAD